MMLCHILWQMETIWCFWYTPLSPRVAWSTGKRLSAREPLLLWYLPAGPAVWMLVLGAVRCWLCGPGNFLPFGLGVPITA